MNGLESIRRWGREDRLEAVLSRQRGWAIGGLVALAVVARLIGLDRGMWVDELKTWMVSGGAGTCPVYSMADMLADRFQQGHLPLYFILMRYWIGFTGPVAWAMRLPSVALGVAGVYLLLRLGEEGYAPKVAFAGAALLAIHELDLWASQIVRMYALLSFLAIGASLQLIRLERAGRWRNWAGLFVCAVLGLLTQALFAFFMLSQIVYLLWNHGRRVYRQWKPFLAWAVAWACAAPVWLVLKARQTQIGVKPDPGEVSPGRMFRNVTRAAVGDYRDLGYGDWMVAMAAVCMVVAAGLVLWSLFRRARLAMVAREEDKAAEGQSAAGQTAEGQWFRARALTRYVVCWVGVYLLAMFVFSDAVQNKAGSSRYYTPITGGFCLGFAAAIYLMGNWSAQWAMRAQWVKRARYAQQGYALLVAVTLLITAVAWWLNRGDGLWQSLEWIESRRAPGERVLGCNAVSVGNAYRFYKPDAAQTAFVGILRTLEKPGEAEKIEVEKTIAANVAPGKTVWLLLYHEKESPITKVVEKSPRFKALEKREIGDAEVFHVERVE